MREFLETGALLLLRDPRVKPGEGKATGSSPAQLGKEEPRD
jgi:hypothetical protein